MERHVRETVTPQRARELLAKSETFKNRALNKAWVSALARAMRSGSFTLHYAPVIIDTDGRVIDGQHRLNAIVESGCEVELSIVYGVPTDAFKHADIVRPRRAGDVLGIMGVRNYNAVAVALSWIGAYRRGELQISRAWKAVAPYEVANELASHPALEECVHLCIGGRNLFSAGMAGGFLYLFREKDEVLADAFMEATISGLCGKRGDPAWELHRRCVENRLSNHPARPIEVAAWMVRAWNAARDGRELQRLIWKKNDEPFPVIL